MVCIIGSETTQNYGLFDDLNKNENYRIVYTEPFNVYEKIQHKISDRIRNMEALKHTMSWEKEILNTINKYHILVVLDTALRRIDLSFLYKCKLRNPQIRVYCLLLNSVSSITLAEGNVSSRIKRFPWDTIYTFDPLDAQKNRWKYIGFNYYSKHRLVIPVRYKYDAFYAGTIVGERGDRVFQLYNYLTSNNVTCEFICPRLTKKRDGIPEGIHLIHKRIPYKKVLDKTVKANCIIEFVQDGQSGPSLRYFEAVCYNKKLYTTNQKITQYPFYNEQYMKVFNSIYDIDLNWIKNTEDINYRYTDEFSPKYLNIERE